MDTLENLIYFPYILKQSLFTQQKFKMDGKSDNNEVVIPPKVINNE